MRQDTGGMRSRMRQGRIRRCTLVVSRYLDTALVWWLQLAVMQVVMDREHELRERAHAPACSTGVSRSGV